MPRRIGGVSGPGREGGFGGLHGCVDLILICERNGTADRTGRRVVNVAMTSRRAGTDGATDVMADFGGRKGLGVDSCSLRCGYVCDWPFSRFLRRLPAALLTFGEVVLGVECGPSSTSSPRNLN